ncbi:MAG: exo-alpha-sialidase [Bacteroidota bacterium]
MKRVLIFFGLLFSIGLSAQSPNQNISNYTFSDCEPFIAVNPANPNNVIAAWIKVTGFTQAAIAVSYSNNAGQTWSSPQNMGHLSASWTSADPSITFNSSGTAFLAYVDYEYPSLDSGAVAVVSSANGGMTWSSPVQAIDGLINSDKPVDRPWIVADNSGGTYNGRLYITSKNYENGSTTNHVYYCYSSDNGMTWSPLAILDDVIPCDLVSSMGCLTVGADGTVYIAYFSYNLASSLFPRVILSKSIDGGANFSESVITNITGASVINDTLQGSMNLSANPIDPNNLILTVTDGRNGDADILCIRSTNGGTTWNNTTPVRINDDALGNGNEQDMCWASFAPDGTFAAAWRDRRNGGTSVTSPFEIWIAASVDGGAAFSVNKNVSTALSPDIPLQKGNDFIGIALSNDFVFTDWSDFRGPNYEIYTNRDSLSSLVSVYAHSAKEIGLICYPNPFTDEITFSFELKENVSKCSISVFDMNGKKIKTIHQGPLTKGKHEFNYNGKNLKAGNYVFVMETVAESYRKVFVKE